MKKAEVLAQKVAGRPAVNSAFVIGLEGELGAGKTVFTKGFARGLGIKAKITSPTFVLMRTYQAKSRSLFHIDAYRLKDEKDFLNLGIREILNDPINIVLVEWSDRVKKALPENYLKIHIDHIDEKTRKVSIQTFADTSFLRRTIRRRTAKEASASV